MPEEGHSGGREDRMAQHRPERLERPVQVTGLLERTGRISEQEVVPEAPRRDG